jgi:hypothetical protein
MYYCAGKHEHKCVNQGNLRQCLGQAASIQSGRVGKGRYCTVPCANADPFWEVLGVHEESD